MTKQKIIVGIDYTASSLNALKYAELLAYRSNCELLLFHLFEAPVLYTNSGLYFMSYQSIEKNSKKKLEDYALKNLKASKVEYSLYSANGVFENVIEYLLKKNKVHSVVLGLESKTKINKFIYGTSGTSIVGKVNCPIIIVPESYKKQSIGKSILAFDNAEKLSKTCLKNIKNYINTTQTKLDVFHIKTPLEVFSTKEVIDFKIDEKLVYPVKIKKSSGIVEGIVNTAKSGKTQSIISISRRHSFIYRFFNESHTKEIAFQSKVPVVIIHE